MSLIPYYLTTGFHVDRGENLRRHFDDHPHFEDDGVLTVRIAIDGYLGQFAKSAFTAWDDLIGFDFEYVDGPAQITILQNNNFNLSQFTVFDLRDREGDVDEVWSTTVVTSKALMLIDPREAYQLMLHEIGHALGLGHAGPYNGTDPQPIFPDDVTTNSIMSYIDPPDGRVVMTPQELDLEAIWSIYGRPNEINGGDDTYVIRADEHWHIEDDGGYDVIRLIGDGSIDMRPGSETASLSLGADTVIEAVYFDDDATVQIMGSAGNDVIGVW